ncbi:MAG: xanthine dehydrogenase [Methanobacteriota archaeon]|nr:MAG: xanthine dehydrogenase [Euryarchaeota archaeon]
MDMLEELKQQIKDLKNIDSKGHVTGKSLYVDDIITRKDTLVAGVLGSPIAHGIIESIDISEALAEEGIKAVLLAKDIPGENQIGGIVPDEELLASREVHFQGQSIAVIVGETEASIRKAKNKIRIDLKELDPVTDPREAFKKGKIILKPRTFELGNVETVFQQSDLIIVDGSCEIGGQEHLYLETQGAYAVPKEKGMFIISSTQGPTAVQKTVARILGWQMHQVEVDVTRLGGGFGGKEDQATAWACMAALGAFHLNQPIKLILDRDEDLKMTGKRHPYSVDFRIAATPDGIIKGYQVMFYQNAGAAADLSPAVLERTLFHCTNAYFIPNVKATAVSCKTNLPPNTAFRGFGGPQGMFAIESAIQMLSQVLNVPKEEIQKKNLISEEQEFPYGQLVRNAKTGETWNQLETEFSIQDRIEEINNFNQQNFLKKKGYAFMPICFGISFTKTSLNQASALVNIYLDGSVGISTGAVEMGQGVNTRIAQVPMAVFNLPIDKVKIETTNTTRIINTSPSAASSTADLNGKATELACERLKKRLVEFAADLLGLMDAKDIGFEDGFVTHQGFKTELTWENLIEKAYLSRISLSEKGFYATPEIYFDPKKEKGHPFAYHVFGTAFFEVTIDLLRGNYEIDRVSVVHDVGRSMNRSIDLGQLEGGLVQGIGWMTMEDLRFDNSGRLLSNALSTYKIPDIMSVPKVIETRFIEEPEPFGILKSKAIGEPPLMYGIGVYFALLNALQNFRQVKLTRLTSPMTPERLFLYAWNLPDY